MKPHIVRTAAGTAVLRILSLALGFLTNIVLARSLGVNEYGTFSYVLAWVGLLGAVGIFGLDRLLVREVAVYNARSDWGRLRGLLSWAHFTSFLISAGIVAIAIVTVWLSTKGVVGTLLVLLPISGCFFVLVVMNRITGSAIQGFSRIVAGQLGETLVQPGVGLILITVAAVLSNWKLTAPNAVSLYAISAGVAVLISGWLLQRTIPGEARSTPRRYEIPDWITGALPLFLISALDMLNRQASVLILGAFSGSEALGIYAAADRLAQLVPFPLTVINLTLATSFAILYQSEDHAGLQRLVTKSARLVLIFSVPIAMILIFGGRWFLLLFGNGFTDGQTALTILCAGQLVNAVIGSVGYLLIMTGHGRDAAVGIGVGAGANILLSLLLIPAWGVNGAAAASGASMIIWNAVLAVFVRKRIGIFTTAFHQ